MSETSPWSRRRSTLSRSGRTMDQCATLTDLTPFPRVWASLDARQQRLLRAAYDLDRQLPHGCGFDKVLPLMKWRTLGVMAGLHAGESDEVVRELAGRRLVMVVDEATREIVLICRQGMRELIDDERVRRQRPYVIAAIVLATIL